MNTDEKKGKQMENLSLGRAFSPSFERVTVAELSHIKMEKRKVEFSKQRQTVQVV